MWEFMAESWADACNCISRWMKAGIIPKHDGWDVYENPTRPGYWIARKI